uniref:Uncharacterized protein n=1 Tax=Anas platyrhynchos TaxID=8839 RepID=A0A8B9SXM8_ANAPL
AGTHGSKGNISPSRDEKGRSPSSSPMGISPLEIRKFPTPALSHPDHVPAGLGSGNFSPRDPLPSQAEAPLLGLKTCSSSSLRLEGLWGGMQSRPGPSAQCCL